MRYSNAKKYLSLILDESQRKFLVANCFHRDEMNAVIQNNKSMKENQFDVVITNFTFNYATEETMISSLFQTCYKLLRPGSIIVG